jgi:hypothetical protein
VTTATADKPSSESEAVQEALAKGADGEAAKQTLVEDIEEIEGSLEDNDQDDFE